MNSRFVNTVNEALSSDSMAVTARWARKAGEVSTAAVTSAKAKSPAADRFIPARGSGSSFEASAAAAGVESALAAESEGARFTSALASSLLPTASAGGAESLSGSRVLAFKGKAPAPAEGHVSSLHVLYSANGASSGAGGKVKTYRHIPSAPERILDAPALADDYYLNLLDWSASNTLAVALGASVFLWNGSTGSITELLTLAGDDAAVTSVSWSKEGGGFLAVGTGGAEVQLWDAEKGRQVRSMRGHAGRVGALDWAGATLSSGSRSGSIFNHDVRVREHHVATLAGHAGEVCGLKWSPDGAFLASGGNDNRLCIWDAAATSAAGVGAVVAPRHTLTEHQAAVKALAWCPWQKGVLASGGGTADRAIKVWNAPAGAMLSSTDTGSQVCSLAFNPHERELLSSHGFSQNQLALWKFPTMAKLKELNGHTARVLHMAVSPDGSTVCSAAADETLRFWRVFGEAAPKADAKAAAAAAPAPALVRGLTIR